LKDGSPPRPNVLTRALLHLIRGPEAEFLLGDLEESWRDRVAGPAGRWRAEVQQLNDVVRSVARWRGRRTSRVEGMTMGGLRADGPGRDESNLTGLAARAGATLAQAFRGLRRRPGFAAVTVGTLALGIGATTTILSVVDGVMLRPLPYPESDRLVAMGVTFPGREWNEEVEGLQRLAGVSFLNFRYVAEQARTLDRVAGAEAASVLLPDEGDGPEIVPMARVSEAFFGALGVEAVQGRLFVAEEYEGPAGAPPILLSYGTWRDRFGLDPDVVGQTLPGRGEGAAPVIVGVLPAGFQAPEGFGLTHTEFWQPLDPTHPRYDSRGARSMVVLGRLAPGASVESVRSELTTLAAELARDFPDGNVYPDGTHFGWGANRLRDHIVGSARRPLLFFLGAAGLLLAIAAMNAAGLLLARATDRIGELNLRRTLGAGRGTIVGQLLTESLLLSALGGLLGVGVAWLGVETFLALSPRLPRLDGVGVDGRILGLTALISVGSGLVAGLAPGLGVGRRALARGIRGTDRGNAGSGARLRDGLVSLQLALALVLAVGASVLMHSFMKVRAVHPGFAPAGLVQFTLSTKRPGVEGPAWAAWDEALASVDGVQGVLARAATSNLPFEDPNWAPPVRLPDERAAEAREGIAGYAVTPTYFETLGQPVLAGRGFLPTDGPEGEGVIVLNQALVDRDFRGEAPLGQVVHLSAEDEESPGLRVVGVVANTILRRVEEGPLPAVYVPYTQTEWPWTKVVIRTDRTDPKLFSDLRRAAAAVSPVVPIQRVQRVSERIRRVEAEPRFHAVLVGTFALAALLLAAVGLYASLAHAVGRRTREMGIRMALGAEPGRVFGLVVRYGVGLALVGAVLGLAGAVALTRVLEAFVFGVPALDPAGVGVAAVALLGVVLLATARPALRAARVDVVRSIGGE